MTGVVPSRIITWTEGLVVPDTESVVGSVSGDDVDWDATPGSFGGDQWKQPVRCATTAAITIATALNAGDTIDGVTLVAGDRVLVKDQGSGGVANGIYVVGSTPARAADLDDDDEVLGAVVYVIDGTANAGTVWTVTNTAATVVDTDGITWAQLSGSGGGTSPAWIIDANDPAYGCIGDGATDDTAHRQAALDAAVAAAIANHGVGIVEYDDGIYLHSGALVTTGHYYAQVILPERAGTASKLLIIERPKNRSGVLFPSGIQSASVVAPVIFESTLTGLSYSGTHGWPSITGGPDPQKTATFSNICYHSDGISYRAPANPSIAGINAKRLNQCIVEDAYFDTTDVATSITQPTHPTGAAVLMPDEGNNAVCEYRGNVWAVGWYAGPGVGEHTRLSAMASYRCTVGLNIQGDYYHAADLSLVATEHCPYHIAYVDPSSGPANPSGASGFAAFNIATWTIEDAASGWAMTTAHIHDPGNDFRGRARVVRVSAGVGNPSPQTLTVSGATGYGIDYILDGPPATAAFASPSIALGTAAAAGAASTVIRSDATIAAFDATVPVSQNFGDTAATGSAAFAARRDHVHGMPAAPTGGSSGPGDHEHMVDVFAGDGSTTAFELTDEPIDPEAVVAFVAGAETVVTMSGAMNTTATFAVAPGAAARVVIQYPAVSA